MHDSSLGRCNRQDSMHTRQVQPICCAIDAAAASSCESSTPSAGRWCTREPPLHNRGVPQPSTSRATAIKLAKSGTT
eukprot:9232884-Alexandrium_andersonii.AAC.1